jgi:hypothetical protein
LGVLGPDGRVLVLYYGKSLDLSRRYALEEDGVLRDKETARFKNRVYTAAVGVLRYRRIGIELAAAAATSAATAAADDWSSGDESDPEDEAASRGRSLGGKLGGKNGSREAKQRAGKLGGKLGGKN